MPFFSRFGRLNPVQIEAIPKILSGANVVIAAGTASGKTEAVVAPVVELLLAGRWEGIAVVYVVPTKALANDLGRRLLGPLDDLGIRVVIKHGDRPQFPKTEGRFFLITTPESLDSLLCRRPHMLSGIRTVILDEIHILDGTYRGDQLRCLLRRLGDVTAVLPSTHLLSATLANPRATAARYTTSCEEVNIQSNRELKHSFCESLEETARLSRARGWKKLLVFCNLRESVEEVAAQLAPLWKPYPVVAHHGSLSSETRAHTEAVMREQRVAACVATSSLEVGIDIGNIDAVVLAEPPWSVSALMQRVGRAGRRGKVAQAAVITSSPEERLLIQAMFEQVEQGRISEDSYAPDLSVVVQQIASVLYGNPGGASLDTLSIAAGALCETSDLLQILDKMADNGWTEHRISRWWATTKLMDLGEKGRGRLHSNIPDQNAYTVFNALGGSRVGAIGEPFDLIFTLARKAWKVESVDHARKRVVAKPYPASAPPPLFERHRGVGAFHSWLPRELRR